MTAIPLTTGAEPTANTSRWYAVQVQPSRGHIATLNLERQGFKTFVPMVSRTRIGRTGKRSERLEPLFPGYQFVQLDEQRDQWRSVNGTIGVARLVMFGDRPAAFSEGFVEELIAAADERAVVAFSDPLSPGDKVRVVGGAFDDLMGTLVKQSGPDRVILLMNLLSGSTRVEMDAAALVRA